MSLMQFRALLVSADPEAAAVLTPVLQGFGLGLHTCGYGEAIRELSEQKFDAVVVDFDDPARALLILQNAYPSSPRKSTVTVALLRDQGKVRTAFGAGAHFVLYKPISPEHAQASLRAATVLIRRERRRSLRVPVQVPVQLRIMNGVHTDGILMDLSEDGMEVLSPQPLSPASYLSLEFNLPDDGAHIQAQGEVAWASPNGQAGVRFLNLTENLRASLAAWVMANTRKLPPEEAETTGPCKLTDLSQGGCYVETESPFPEHTVVFLGLKAGTLEMQVLGMVRVMHPEFGMGIEFACGSAQDRKQMEDFIRFLIHHPGSSPELSVTPRGLAKPSDALNLEHVGAEEWDDALLDLLRSHESLSQRDFLHALQKQRNSAAVAVS
jgi:CheY-like chemotaxis protein